MSANFYVRYLLQSNYNFDRASGCVLPSGVDMATKLLSASFSVDEEDLLV